MPPTQPRTMSPTEAEMRRINDLVNQVYNEVLGNIPVIYQLPVGGNYDAMVRELESKLTDLRTYYMRNLDIEPDRRRVLSDLLQMVEDSALKSTIQNTLFPPAPAWVRQLDELEGRILEAAGIPASAEGLLAPQLSQAVDAIKSSLWFRPNPPTNEELLVALRQRVSDTRLLNAIDALMLPPMEQPAAPPAAVPSRVEEAPPEEEVAAPAPRAPARHAAHAGPTISELASQGYTNVHSEGYYGMTIMVAENDEGQRRYFETDSRGRTKKEIASDKMDSMMALYQSFRAILSEIESAIPNYASMDFDTRAAINEEIERITNRLFTRYAGRSIPSREELLQQLRSAARGEELVAALDTLA